MKPRQWGPVGNTHTHTLQHWERRAHGVPAEPGFTNVRSKNVASPNSPMSAAPSPNTAGKKTTLHNSNSCTRLHNSSLDPKEGKICMTQSFKWNCSVSEDKDKTGRLCGGKQGKASKHNNGRPVLYFPGPSTQLITHRLQCNTTPAPHTSALTSRICDLVTPEPNQRGYTAGF